MSKMTCANLTWQTDNNGLSIPVSTDFADVYFCKENGLNESRYVFIEQNNLQNRLENLDDYQRFVIAEIGFGTGLNVLATWQLWQKITQKNPNKNSHLHIITTEKFPLTAKDLQQALAVWQELAPFSQQLLANYPPPLAGCHRLNFWQDRLTIDLWLGDACESLSQIIGHQKVDAWFLDGFAPACNSELWEKNLFSQIKRLSKATTTLSTFSVANIVKNNLKNQGFCLKKVKGFGKKREMLTAFFAKDDAQNQTTAKQTTHHLHQLKFQYNKKIPPFWTKIPFLQTQKTRTHTKQAKTQNFVLPNIHPTDSKVKNSKKPLKISIIGAGVAGLSCAYALAMRGHDITIFDKNAPICGASGNIRGVLAPKLTALHRLQYDLHTIGFLASCRFYPALQNQTNFEILETTGCLDLLVHNRINLNKDFDFPKEFASFYDANATKQHTNFALGQAIFTPKSGLIHTKNFAQAVLSLPNIRFIQAKLQSFQQKNQQIGLNFNNSDLNQNADHLILTTALATCDFLPQLKKFNHSRGQISWLPIDPKTAATLPNIPLKYGGYCAKFYDNHTKQNFVMLGASFVRDTLDTTAKLADLISNIKDLQNFIPDLANRAIFQQNLHNWQGRASIRCQTVDYLPLVGQVYHADFSTTSHLWTFCALGSKGYAYAPICSELIAGLICGEILPLSETMVKKLTPNRRALQQ
ncbi:hypothetical protein MOMA_07501 [Moraxella macacae 0408225]|uniref:tRNA 5-methylaminomethyl-2-thiouridine biosynthesis bifunctional protein MnmC n=1 Tax=Moraxella macacae 0408225 TaxID=1230338 RepID=L2F7F0_9GAMM|nr:FAD-dependent 5-carboxymethylaminomethyl-2-thiouridine(34) oxidoreductase MnmC [Moraxella macacae]ELA08388.1 hypothetical protein MOMA_07501 [Moraxella macacae 0408225]